MGSSGDPSRTRRKHPTISAELAAEDIKAGLDAAGVNCDCRDTVEAIFDRVTRARRAQQQLGSLRDARQRRNGIAALLELLVESDEITGADPSVFEEAAALFEDIAALAVAGAKSSRKAGALRPIASNEGGRQ